MSPVSARRFPEENSMLFKAGAVSILFYAALVLPGAAQAVNEDSAATEARAYQYKLLDLGIWGSVAGINNRGQVVGKNNANNHAFMWDRGTVTDLGALGTNPYEISQAMGINSHGEI